ncbi:MAG: porin family protein, partial [Prevotella sp.]|nr:porin family protein [Prevotella sp.]
MKNYATNPMMRLAMMAILLVSSLGIWAQEDEEYRMEIGGGIGVTGYLGDFNSSLTKNLQPAASVVLRRYFNP